MASESDGFGYGPVGKLRPLAIRVSERHGQAEDSSIFHVPVVVVYPGRATDGDAGEQHMCSATCGFVGPWMDPTPRFQKIHGRVGERDVACHSRPITTSPPLDGVVDQAFRQALGPWLSLPDSLWLPCTPPGPDRSTGGGGWIADASFDALPRSILPFWLGSAAICILQ